MRALFAAGTIAALVTVGSIGSASAQARWSGFYVGIHAGYAWGQSDIGTTASCPSGNLNGTCFTVNGVGINRLGPIGAAASGSISSGAFNGGAQAGVNWQSGTLVYGFELDIGALNLGGSVGATRPYVAPNLAGAAYTVGASVDTDWLATARARLGLAVAPDVLVYMTGGLALTNVEVSNSFSDNSASVGGTRNAGGGSSRSETKTGWALGGGAEYALSRTMSVKAEYLYVDFGAVTSNGFFAGAVRTQNSLDTTADLSAHLARVGLNVKF